MSNDLAEEAKRLSEQASKLRQDISDFKSAETEPEKPKPAKIEEKQQSEAEISETMKAKLRKELISQGADPNRSSGNGILIVAAVVGVLVLLGGQGIFFGLGPVWLDPGRVFSDALETSI
eukprot:CAMPEP_0171462838 /NCGR_PEP_ID=MMETSP0945-20130129/6723_1 /TAXON_ID=109269 /ORGANISM="Vaucheria litorea, Strain CCMP2940" /LENGTH=119 /DNA_ID=CAMNT_0011989459 /DNA_START=163 /DNA_END=522 /DNA_ORIENTATION=+